MNSVHSKSDRDSSLDAILDRSPSANLLDADAVKLGAKRRLAAIIDKSKQTPSEELTIKNADSLYSPWSRSLLLSRLSTYTSKYWTIPDSMEINALTCARRGWKAIGKNTLQCVFCHQMLHVAMSENTATWRILQEKYLKDIVDRHSTTCLWRQKGSDKSVYDTCVGYGDQCKARCQGLIDALHGQDDASAAFIIEPKLTPSQIKKILKIIGDSDAQEYGESILTLGFYGWEFSMNIQNTIIVCCKVCFRKLILNSTVNVITEHRAYCPYRKWTLPDGGSEGIQARLKRARSFYDERN